MSSLDDLLGLLQRQQAFVKKHAQRVRRECANCTSKEVQWELFGMAIGAEEALAAVEASPELLTKLDFRKRGRASKKSASPWEAISTFFGGGTGASSSAADGRDGGRGSGGGGRDGGGGGGGGTIKAIDVERELGTVLSAREVGQVYGHVSTSVAETLKTTPKPGLPTGFDLAVQLPLDGRCPGEGGDGAVFLTACLEFEAQNGLRDRRDTLSVDTRLYTHTDGYLGGQVDRLVDIAGLATDAEAPDADASTTMPAVAVAPDEVRVTLAKEGVYLASTSVTFIVHEERPIDPERVGVVAHAVTKKLVETANAQIREFFERRRSARAIAGGSG